MARRIKASKELNEKRVAWEFQHAVSLSTEEFQVHDFTSFSINGFKAFGAATAVIPIRPLTIIFGANSSGKSSIIHSLLYLNEVARTGNLDIYKPWLSKDSIDLGGYYQCNNRENYERIFKFTFNNCYDTPEQIIGEKVATIGLTWTVQLTESKHAMADLKTESSFRINGEDVIQIYGPSAGEGHVYDGIYWLDSQKIWYKILIHNKIIKKNIKLIIKDNYNDIIEKKYSELAEDLSWSGVNCLINFVSCYSSLENLLSYNISEFTFQIASNMDALFSKMEYYGPFRDYRTRESTLIKMQIGSRKNRPDEIEDPFQILFMDSDIRNHVNKWLGNSKSLDLNYEIVRRKYLRVDEVVDYFTKFINEKFNDMPETDAFDMDEYAIQLGEEIDFFKDPSAVDLARKSLLLIEAIQFSSKSKASKDVELLAKSLTVNLFESIFLSGFDQLMIADRTNGKDLSLRDVGVGLSQVLPLVVAAYSSKNAFMMMEQPELHIHPGLQAELADVFIESAIGPNQNTLCLETHSEHLLLRILRRIRETSDGSLPAGLCPLRPEDVSIVYVQKGQEGSEVINIPITNSGDFAVPWPKGFFPERAEELFGS